MKSKNQFQTFETQKTMIKKQQWKQDFQEQLQKIKRPFLNRIGYSKLKIQSKVSNSKQQTQAVSDDEPIIRCIRQKLFQNKLLPVSQSKINSQQSEHDLTEKIIPRDANKENKLNFQKESKGKKQSDVRVENQYSEWQGRDRSKLFKNSTNMQEQFERVFNNKLGLNYPQKKEWHSYREDEREMLQKVYDQLKDVKQDNCVTFKRMQKFFADSKLFFTVYGITSADLQDIISSSAQKYPDRLTKQQFLQTFLNNTQTRTQDELQNKVQKKCCMEQGNWEELRNLFNQLDTFGKGAIKTREFSHKMKTVSASKQLLECKVIDFANINKFYTFSKVLFELEHKITLPNELSWNQLSQLITNFSHIETPTMDQIYNKHIMEASIIPNQTNTFLIKVDTIKILKDEFSRCPKFNDHFVKSKYFCDKLLSLESITFRSKELVRNCPKGQGFINLLANIRMLYLQGPEYLDMDQMLTYFSVKGFQEQAKIQILRKSFSAQSTTSEEQWEERKKQQRRLKRMKSLDQMDKVIKKINNSNYEKQDKPVSRPVLVKQFNLTKPREHMTIRQGKVKQMIEEKQQKQLSEIKPFIQANPIPATCNGQRYLQEQTKQRIKRQLERQKRQKQREIHEKKIRHLMSNTKLFEKCNPYKLEEQSKMYMSPQPKQQFQAKSMSWFIKERNLLTIIESEKAEKRKNRLRQTQEKYVFGYWKNLPYEGRESNFKKMNQNLQACKNTEQSLQVEFECQVESADKAKSPRLKLGIVPDFAKLQKEFMEQLESKKRIRSPTVIKQFNLSVSKKREPEFVEENAAKKVSPSKKTVSNAQMCKTQRPAIVGTTKKFQSMLQLTQRRMILKRYEAELEKFQQNERKQKEKIFAKFMKKAIKQQQQSKPRPVSMKSKRKRKDQSTIEQENELKKMYQRVLSRPFLFQAVSDNQPMKKKGRKQKKSHKRQEPKKVQIPLQNDNQKGCAVIIPPLNYIQDQYEEDNYDQMMKEDGKQIARAFDRDSEEYEQQSYDEGRFVGNQMNQSF